VEGYFTALDVYPAQLTAVGLAKPAEEFFDVVLSDGRIERRPHPRKKKSATR